MEAQMEVIDVDSYEIEGFQRRRPAPSQAQPQSRQQRQSRLKTPNFPVTAEVNLCSSDEEDGEIPDYTAHNGNSNSVSNNQSSSSGHASTNKNLDDLPLDELQIKKELLEIQLKTEGCEDVSDNDGQSPETSKITTTQRNEPAKLNNPNALAQPSLCSYEIVSDEDDDDNVFDKSTEKSPKIPKTIPPYPRNEQKRFAAAANPVPQSANDTVSKDASYDAVSDDDDDILNKSDHRSPPIRKAIPQARNESGKSNNSLKANTVKYVVVPNHVLRTLGTNAQTSSALEAVSDDDDDNVNKSDHRLPKNPKNSKENRNEPVHTTKSIENPKINVSNSTPSLPIRPNVSPIQSCNTNKVSPSANQKLQSDTSNQWIRLSKPVTLIKQPNMPSKPLPSLSPQSNRISSGFNRNSPSKTQNQATKSINSHGYSVLQATNRAHHTSTPNQKPNSSASIGMTGKSTSNYTSSQSFATNQVQNPSNQFMQSNRTEKPPIESLHPLPLHIPLVRQEDTENDLLSQLFTSNTNRLAPQTPQTPESGIANSDISSDFDLDITLPNISFMAHTIPTPATSSSSVKTVWSSKSQVSKEELPKTNSFKSNTHQHFNFDCMSNTNQATNEHNSYVPDSLLSECNQSQQKRRASNEKSSNSECNIKRQRKESSSDDDNEEADMDDDCEKDPSFEPDEYQEDEEEDNRDDNRDEYDSDASIASDETVPYESRIYQKGIELKPCKMEIQDENSCDSSETVLDTQNVLQTEPSK